MSVQRIFLVCLIMLTSFLSSCGKEEKKYHVGNTSHIENKMKKPVIIKNKESVEEVIFGGCIFKGNIKFFKITCKTPISTIMMNGITNQHHQRDGKYIDKLSEYVVQGSFEIRNDITPVSIIHNDGRESEILIEAFKNDAFPIINDSKNKFDFCEVSYLITLVLDIECRKPILNIEIVHTDANNNIRVIHKEEKKANLYIKGAIHSKVEIIFNHSDGTKSQFHINPPYSNNL